MGRLQRNRTVQFAIRMIPRAYERGGRDYKVKNWWMRLKRAGMVAAVVQKNAMLLVFFPKLRVVY